MQRICRVRGGVNAYLQNPGALVTEQTRQCPFCRDVHLLWLFGWYWRWVVLPTPEEAQKIPIRRQGWIDAHAQFAAEVVAAGG